MKLLSFLTTFPFFYKPLLPKIITTIDGTLNKPKDKTSLDKKIVYFDISEIAFVNWNAGGTSSVSGLLKTKFNRAYNTDNYNWSNE
jgi:hypothetical protein